MRNFKYIVRAFVGAAAITTLAACEEQEPPKTTRATVEAPVATPAPAKQPEVRVEAPKPTPPPAPVVKVEDDKEDAGVDDTLKSARDAINQGELNRALKLARIATKKAPKRSSSWNTLGRVQLKRGEKKDAIASFEKAVELNPSSSFAQNNLGLALIYDGKYEEAVDALEEATQLEPVEAYMWNNLGMAYEHLDRLDDARDAYKQAIATTVEGMSAETARTNFARLEGVKTVKPMKTAKIDTVEKSVEKPAEPMLPEEAK